MRSCLSFFITGLIFISAFCYGSNLHAEETAVKELKSSYLQSINDDCRIFLEGIELFIRRDYRTFWENIDKNVPVPQGEIERYSRELKHFEGQLDALYEEYISYKAAEETRDIGQKSAMANKLDQQIFQMLAFSYIRTGDFAMAYALMQDNKILDENVVINIIDIEGKKKPFNLTREIKKLFRIINKNLNILKLNLKYFYPSDIKDINAYLKVSGYDHRNPFNKVYFSYYHGTFLGLGEGDQDNIHFSEIIHFFNRLKYNNIFKNNQTDYEVVTYNFPIVKGSYSPILKDDTIIASISPDNKTLNMERLCMFKGFVRTDFRQLKGEEKQNIKKKNLIDKGLYLEQAAIIKTDDKNDGKNSKKKRLLDSETGHNSLKINDMLRYGVYRLYENDKFLGTIELVPCYKGENCRKKSNDKSITKVKVYNHELTFYQDILDLVSMNQKMYGKNTYSESSDDDYEETTVDDSGDYNYQDDNSPSSEQKSRQIHIGRGCASKRSAKTN